MKHVISPPLMTRCTRLFGRAVVPLAVAVVSGCAETDDPAAVAIGSGASSIEFAGPIAKIEILDVAGNPLLVSADEGDVDSLRFDLAPGEYLFRIVGDELPYLADDGAPNFEMEVRGPAITGAVVAVPEGDPAQTLVVEAAAEEDGLGASAQPLTLASTFYAQRDSRWSSNRLGTCSSSTTVGTHGCAVASVAIALRARGSSATPATLNTWLTSNSGYLRGCEIVWATAANFDGTGGLVWEGTGSLSSSVSTLRTALDARKLIVVASTRYSGRTHWVLLTGYRGTSPTSIRDFTYWDPMDSSATTRYVGDGWVSSGNATRVYR